MVFTALLCAAPGGGPQEIVFERISGGNNIGRSFTSKQSQMKVAWSSKCKGQLAECK